MDVDFEMRNFMNLTITVPHLEQRRGYTRAEAKRVKVNDQRITNQYSVQTMNDLRESLLEVW